MRNSIASITALIITSTIAFGGEGLKNDRFSIQLKDRKTIGAVVDVARSETLRR